MNTRVIPEIALCFADKLSAFYMLGVLFLLYRLALSFWVPEEFPLLSHSHLPPAFCASRDLFGCCILTLRRQLQRNTCGERISCRFSILPVASARTCEVWGWVFSRCRLCLWLGLFRISIHFASHTYTSQVCKKLTFSEIFWPMVSLFSLCISAKDCNANFFFFLANAHNYLKFSLLSLFWMTGGFLES